MSALVRAFSFRAERFRLFPARQSLCEQALSFYLRPISAELSFRIVLLVVGQFAVDRFAGRLGDSSS